MTRPLDWPDRVDVTEEALGDPAFWVTFCRVDPVFIDAAVDQNAYYASFLMRQLEAGTWPFMRADVGGTKYVEVELTDDHERRLWIGDRRLDRRVLLGIDSGTTISRPSGQRSWSGSSSVSLRSDGCSVSSWRSAAPFRTTTRRRPTPS